MASISTTTRGAELRRIVAEVCEPEGISPSALKGSLIKSPALTILRAGAIARLKEAGFTQAVIAQSFGVSRSYLDRYTLSKEKA